MRTLAAAILAAWLSLLAPPAAAQDRSRVARGASVDDAFLDPAARPLLLAARARWEHADTSLVRYQARVSQRMAASIRLPVHDRVFYHYEAAARLIWERDGGVAMQMLASHEEFPWGVTHSGRVGGVFQEGYDPRRDPLVLGLEYADNPQVQVQHPLAAGAEEHYRFRTGDTLTVLLPDGGTLRAVELQILPRTDDPHLLAGALWIEPTTGALVRAVYRPARDANLETDTRVDLSDPNVGRIPGLFRPFVASVKLVSVDYALWDLRVWMPHAVHAEGTLHAGVMSMPMTVDMAYDIEEVDTADEGAAPLGVAGAVDRLAQMGNAAGETAWKPSLRTRRRSGRTIGYVLPEDRSWLDTSPYLPAPAWDPEDAGFATPAELADLQGILDGIPVTARVAPAATLAWGLDGSGLIRYNRVEGLSAGARGAIRFGVAGVPLSAALTARLGSADRAPRATLSLAHEGRSRSLTLSAFHELRLMEPSARGLELGNSASALFFGRDDGDYYEATGTALDWSPASAERSWYRVRAYAERQAAVGRNTRISLLDWDAGFRDQPAATPGDQVGLEGTLTPWWGRDPTSAGAGIELQLQGERGDFEFERASLGARALLPMPAHVRMALALGLGATWGQAPSQRLWRLGGPASLRGFAPGVRVGRSFLEGRAELARPLLNAAGLGAIGLAVFTDGGWAGDADRIRWDEAVGSAGAGLSLLGGALRLDAAWGWHGASGHRVDFYLDGLL